MLIIDAGTCKAGVPLSVFGSCRKVPMFDISPHRNHMTVCIAPSESDAMSSRRYPKTVSPVLVNKNTYFHQRRRGAVSVGGGYAAATQLRPVGCVPNAHLQGNANYQFSRIEAIVRACCRLIMDGREYAGERACHGSVGTRGAVYVERVGNSRCKCDRDRPRHT